MTDQINDLPHTTQTPPIPKKQHEAFKIHLTKSTLSIPRELVPQCNQDSQNKNQTLISKLISRFTRYRKPPVKPSNIQETTQNQNQKHEEEVNKRIDLKFKKINENHFFVKTSHHFFVYKVNVQNKTELSVNQLTHLVSKDHIMAIDILIGDKLSILMISANSNGEYYLKIVNGPKIDFNQKINGANFLNQKHFLVYLEQEILLYNLETKANRVTLISRTNKINRYNYNQSFTVLRLDSITAVKDTQVFIIYICKVTNNKQFEKKHMVRYNLMLQQFNIIDNQIKNYQNRLLQDYFQEIKLQELITFNYHGKTGLLLVLNNSILFIKQKQDREGHLFFTVEATSVQENCFLLLRQRQNREVSLQQFLLIKHDTTSGNIKLMNLNILRDNKKFQIQDTLQKSLKDIILMKQIESLEVCTAFNDQLLFFFSNGKNIQNLENIKFKIYITEKVLPSSKIDDILNEQLNVDKLQKLQEIPQNSLELLLQLNQTHQKQINPLGNRYSIRNNLYKIIWQKIKEQASSYESRVKLIRYLYKTRDLKYIKSQWKGIIKEQNEIKVDQLKQHYSKLKLLALQELTKNPQGINRVQTFQIYLKSTFYLKKLQVIQQSKLNELDYKRWKKRDITQIFFTQWKARRFNYIKKFLRRFKSYFLDRYERILQKIFQGQNLKNKKLDLLSEDKMELLRIILPFHRKSKDNQGGYTLGFDIDFVTQETCYQDLEINSDLLEEFKKQKNLQIKLSKKYMKNNDFLFQNRQSLRQKQNNLIQNRQSIHVFLAFYIQKCKYTNFQEYKISIDLLRKGQFINLEYYFKFKCQLLMYDEFRNDISPDENLQKFLKLTPTEVFRKIIFENSENLKERIHFLLTKIKNIWEFINNQKNMMVQEQTNSLNEFDIENAQIFETVIKKSFQINQEDIVSQGVEDEQEIDQRNQLFIFQGQLVKRYKMFFTVLHQLQQQYQRNNPLLIQCLIYSVFRTIPVNSFSQDLKQIWQELSELSLREEYPIDLRLTLQLICQNAQFFRVFQIDATIFEIQNRNQYELVHQPNFNLFRQVIQVYLRSRDNITQITFDRQIHKLSTLNQLLQLLFEFCQNFYRRLDDLWVPQLVQQIFEEALTFRLANPQISVDIMPELQQVLAMKKTEEDIQKPIQILKKVIEEAKSKNNFPFIKECLGILEGSHDQQFFVDQQDLMIRLHTKQFTVDTLANVKTDYLKVLQNSQNLDQSMLMTLYVKAVGDFIDNEIDTLAQQQEPITLETILNLVENFSNSRCDKPQVQTFQILYLVIKLLIRRKQICKQSEKSIDSTDSILSLFISLERKDIEEIQKTFKINWLRIVSETQIEQRNSGSVLLIPLQVQAPSNSFHQNKIKLKEKQTRKVEIQIYTYVKQYLNEINYFTFGQLLFYDYERAIIFFLRYRKRLDLSLDKIVLIIKGFLRSNPKNLREEKMSPRLASKSEKLSYKLELTIQMLFSYLKDQYYILRKQKISVIQSQVKQQRESISSKSDSINHHETNLINKILEFITLYKQNSQQIQTQDRQKKITQQNLSKLNKGQKTQRNNQKNNQNTHRDDSKGQKKYENYYQLFMKSSAREFIKTIQTNNQTYDQSSSNNIHNMNIIYPVLNNLPPKQNINININTFNNLDNANNSNNPTNNLNNPSNIINGINKQQSNNNNSNLNISNLNILNLMNTSNNNLNTSNNNINNSMPIIVSQKQLQQQQQPIQIPQKKIFSMYYFRIYTRCIKFNEWMHKLFPFDFFLQTDSTKQVKKSIQDKQYGVKKILQSHLKQPIYKQINQDNFIQIAKSMRYGFNNSQMMQFQIILLYLKKQIQYYKEQNKKENGMQLQQLLKRIKTVLDSVDSQYFLQPKIGRITALLQNMDKDVKQRILKLIQDNR